MVTPPVCGLGPSQVGGLPARLQHVSGLRMQQGCRQMHTSDAVSEARSSASFSCALRSPFSTISSALLVASI